MAGATKGTCEDAVKSQNKILDTVPGSQRYDANGEEVKKADNVDLKVMKSAKEIGTEKSTESSHPILEKRDTETSERVTEAKTSQETSFSENSLVNLDSNKEILKAKIQEPPQLLDKSSQQGTVPEQNSEQEDLSSGIEAKSCQIREKEEHFEEQHKKGLPFKQNEAEEEKAARREAGSKRTHKDAKRTRNSYITKTRGNIYYKKKGPFSKWKSFFVILDDSKQQMSFFKSEEDYEKLSRCKTSIDLRFITEIRAVKPRLFQSSLPFKMYRRAGLSTVKLAADSEEERATWITTIEDIVEKIKASPDRDLMLDKKSSTLPNRTKQSDGVSSDSETCTTSSAPEQDELLIRPKKLSNAGFKIDSNQISSIKLKRTSSEKKEARSSKQPEDEPCDPQEKFGVQLRRIQTEKTPPRHEREQSPEYTEFKQKYNSLSLSRKNKAPNIPLTENTLCSQLVENIDKELVTCNPDRAQIEIKAPKKKRSRSPSPNIPISKGVEAVMKNNEKGTDIEVEMKKVTVTKSLPATVIHHATQAEVPFHESVDEIKHDEEMAVSSTKVTKITEETSELNVADVKSEAQEENAQTTPPTSHNRKTSSVDSISDLEDTVSDERGQAEERKLSVQLPIAVMSDGNSNENVTAVCVYENKDENKIEISETIEEITLISKDVQYPSEIGSQDVDQVSESDKISQHIESSQTPAKEDKSTDPFKLNDLKKFVKEMRNEASKGESIPLNYPQISVVSNSAETTLITVEKQTAETLQSSNDLLAVQTRNNNIAKENVRLSSYSYGSQLSTESDEPLPRLNFLGKTDRTSTGSTCLKDYSERNPEKSSEIEEDQAAVMRDKSIKSKGLKRPDSSSSVGGRSSLVFPEFTVVEENVEDVIAVTAKPDYCPLPLHGHQTPEMINSRENSAVAVAKEKVCKNSDKLLKTSDCSDGPAKLTMDGKFLLEIQEDKALSKLRIEAEDDSASAKKIEELLSQVEICLTFQPDTLIAVQEVSQPEKNTLNNSSMKKEETVVSKERNSTDIKENIITRTDETVTISDPPEKSYINKVEMKLVSASSAAPSEDVKKLYCSETEETIEFLGIEEASDSVPLTETSASKYVELCEEEFEVLEEEEETDYFPSYSIKTEYRTKGNETNATNNNETMRTSGIAGLKQFLRENEDHDCASDVKSGISRLGHSPAIEKLRDEFPKK